MHWVGDQNICGTHLPEIFALLPYYGTQPATSPGHACSHNPDIDINTVKVQNISVPITFVYHLFGIHPGKFDTHASAVQFLEILLADLGCDRIEGYAVIGKSHSQFITSPVAGKSHVICG